MAFAKLPKREWTTAVKVLTAQPMPVPNEKKGFVLSPGGRAGKYLLVEKLGQGTFGSVFKARDTELDREVAFKVLNPTHQMNYDVVTRFLQEARATARIKHPGIVTVLDAGRIETEVGELAFLVMELLEGESLMKRITREKRLAPAVAIEISQQIALALEAAHRADVLHRDLKPDNVFLVPDPLVQSGVRVKVFDFGLAKLGRGGHTMMNTILGTPRYMSPEQCRSSAAIDARSDIYSLGCIVFELLTGKTPFDGDLRRLVEQHQFATPVRVCSLVPDVQPALDDLVAHMLAKDPAARPQTMTEVHAALGGTLAPPRLPTEKSEPTRVVRGRRKKSPSTAPPPLPPAPESLVPLKTTVAFPPPPPNEEPRDMTEIVAPLPATQSEIAAYGRGRWWWLLGVVGVGALAFVLVAFRSTGVRTQPASAAPSRPAASEPAVQPPVIPEQRTPRSSEAPAQAPSPAPTPAPVQQAAAPAPAPRPPPATASADAAKQEIEMAPESTPPSKPKPKPAPVAKKKPAGPAKPKYDPDSLFLKK